MGEGVDRGGWSVGSGGGGEGEGEGGGVGMTRVVEVSSLLWGGV